MRANVFDDMNGDRGFHDKGVRLRWRASGGAEQSVPMAWNGNNQWRGTMPAQAPGAAVQYWVTAADFAGNVGTGPVKAFTEGGTPPIPGDLDGDGHVTGADLGALLGVWGQSGVPADLNHDGTVDGADLGIQLGNWG